MWAGKTHCLDILILPCVWLRSLLWAKKKKKKQSDVGSDDVTKKGLAFMVLNPILYLTNEKADKHKSFPTYAQTDKQIHWQTNAQTDWLDGKLWFSNVLKEYSKYSFSKFIWKVFGMKWAVIFFENNLIQFETFETLDLKCSIYYLFVHLLFIILSLFLSICQYVFLSFCLSVCLSDFLSSFVSRLEFLSTFDLHLTKTNTTLISWRGRVTFLYQQSISFLLSNSNSTKKYIF